MNYGPLIPTRMYFWRAFPQLPSVNRPCVFLIAKKLPQKSLQLEFVVRPLQPMPSLSKVRLCSVFYSIIFHKKVLHSCISAIHQVRH